MELVVTAWNGSREYLGVRPVLDALGGNDWTWRLEEFHGMGLPGSGLNVLELEAGLEAGTFLTMTWDDLLVFADKVHQMIDGLLVAFSGDADSEPALTIESRDSDDWRVDADDRDASAMAAAARVAACKY